MWGWNAEWNYVQYWHEEVESRSKNQDFLQRWGGLNSCSFYHNNNNDNNDHGKKYHVVWKCELEILTTKQYERFMHWYPLSGKGSHVNFCLISFRTIFRFQSSEYFEEF